MVLGSGCIYVFCCSLIEFSAIWSVGEGITLNPILNYSKSVLFSIYFDKLESFPSCLPLPATSGKEFTGPEIDQLSVAVNFEQ